jgi:hypothetical protein
MRYILYIPSELSAGFHEVEQVFENETELIEYANSLLEDSEKVNSEHEARRILMNFAETEKGYFGHYKLCTRHEIEEHPKYGCEECRDENNFTKMEKKGGFDDDNEGSCYEN